MIAEYETVDGAAVAMFATYAQLGGELAALLREVQYARERAADYETDNAKLRHYVAELEVLLPADRRAEAVARAPARYAEAQL